MPRDIMRDIVRGRPAGFVARGKLRDEMPLAINAGLLLLSVLRSMLRLVRFVRLVFIVAWELVLFCIASPRRHNRPSVSSNALFAMIHRLPG